MRSGLNIAALLCAIVAAVALPGASYAQLKVFSSGGFRAPLSEVLPEFERTTGIKITTTWAPSQGNYSNTIGRRLARGENADVVVMSKEGLNDLVAEGRISRGSEIDIAQTPLAVAVRAGANAPDISSVDAFKKLLLSAKTVVFPGSTGGIYLETILFPKLGIAEDLARKTIHGRGDVALFKGDAEVAIQPASELIQESGIQYVGPIPAEIQFISVFTAAIVDGSSEQQAGRRLIEYLASDRVLAALRKSGMEPVKIR